MRFAIVACPSCRRVQPVELRHTRVACRGCRSALEPASLRRLHSCDSELEARTATLRLSAQLNGMPIEDYAELLRRIEAERSGDVEDALASLSKRGEFGRDDLAAEMQRQAVAGDPDRLLDALVAENRVFEPRSGRYRFL